MHVQNRAFGNIGFQSTWVFGSHQWKNRGMEKQSDAMSVQPLWHSLVDLGIIGLDLLDADAGATVGGGEEDLRPLETTPRVLLHCDGRFRRWSSSAKVYGDEAEAGQDNVNLKWDPNIICNR